MYGPPSDCKEKFMDEESLRQCIRRVVEICLLAMMRYAVPLNIEFIVSISLFHSTKAKTVMERFVATAFASSVAPCQRDLEL
jgi:hypothetical protein